MIVTQRHAKSGKLKVKNKILLQSLQISNKNEIISYFTSLRSLRSLREIILKIAQRRKERKVKEK